MNIFNRLWNYHTMRSEHRAKIKELNKLTDHQLRDIGISRCDIDRLIWTKVDRDASGRETK